MTTQTKTNLETTLLELLSQLPKPLQLEVLHFAQFLVSRHHQNHSNLQNRDGTEVGFSPFKFETSFRQALSGQTLPLSELWEEIDHD